MATKEMERKALEKIRKIVADLGENSYIGKAFEGCFEIAETNIDNDFWCSMKEQVESAGKKAWVYRKKANNFAATLKANVNELDELRKKVIDDTVLEDVQTAIRRAIMSMEQEAADAAGQIVDMATSPDCDAFQQAVSKHRTAKRYIERYTELVSEIERVLQQ